MRGSPIRPRFGFLPPRRTSKKSSSFSIRRPILLGGVLLAGVVFGSFWQHMSQQGTNAYLSYFVQQYLDGHSTAGFSAAMASSFLSAMLLQAFILFFSLSCIGTPVLICVPLFKGISIGCVSAYLYGVMGLRGLLTNFILLWIPGFLQSILLVIFTTIALDTSVSLFKLNLLEQKAGTAAKINRCLRIFVFSSLGMLLSSVLEGLLSVIFSPVLLAP